MKKLKTEWKSVSMPKGKEGDIAQRDMPKSMKKSILEKIKSKYNEVKEKKEIKKRQKKKSEYKKRQEKAKQKEAERYQKKQKRGQKKQKGSKASRVNRLHSYMGNPKVGPGAPRRLRKAKDIE